MSRNVEIKARVENVDALRSVVESLADQGPFELTQDDTFFVCADGRLKLRTGDEADEGELIFYQRANQDGPKESFYLRSRTTDPATLREALGLAYGLAGRVQKDRTLYLVGRTRVHLDVVEGLGNFLELEVVLEEQESTATGVTEAQHLLTRLNIPESALIDRAYVDLLRDSARVEATPSALEDSQVRACLHVLQAIKSDRGHLTRLTPAQRRELLTLAGLVAKPDRHDVTRMMKAYRRAKRVAAQEHDRQVLATAGLRVQRRASVYTPLKLERPKPEDLERPAFARERACYVCKKPIGKMHRYYDSMCEACGDFNYAKRQQTADLQGHYALVTGARVKIGFQASLKLLRAGADVIVTTRFPVDAAERYALEPDIAEFQNRLQIHGLDLRHTPSVEIFARFLSERLPRLDYIINNACQTVRRPAGFFEHLLAQETQASSSLPAVWRGLLTGHDALRQALGGASRQGGLVTSAARVHAAGLIESAALSQRRYLDEDYQGDDALFPAHRYDEDRQQVDLREVNSWRLRMHEVETPELLEVHLVNAVAPYILNAKLKPLMLCTAGRHKHVVNVSAMEGQFYRATKTVMHPHTNMAKAALNMMTRTSAPDYEKDGIHMNAVDTGWVTDEDPAVHAARKAELGFSPPLDIIDGAARIVDPIFAGHLSGTHVWGQFLKDYKPAPW